MAIEVKLPALAENVESATVLTVLVAQGARVEVDQPLVELETEKATVELPSPCAGSVSSVLVSEGDEVHEGSVLFLIDVSSAEASASVDTAQPEPVLPEEGATSSSRVEPAKSAAPKKASEPVAPQTAHPKTSAKKATPPFKKDAVRPPATSGGNSSIPASPFVRRLARDLGVDLNQLAGTGDGGRISRHDVTEFARAQLAQTRAPAGPKLPELPDFSYWGAVERETMSTVRRTIAEHMTNAWTQVPHVTHFDLADITELEVARKDFAKRLPEGTGKLTITSIALKVLASALKLFPKFNASVDVAHGEIVTKKYVNLGVAVDTPRGLLVPVLHNVDQMNITEIIRAVDRLSTKARSGKISLEELYGGSFTLTNLGGLGTRHFTPIVNWPEVAILGIGRAAKEAVWKEDAFEPRLIMPVSLSYDHRVIDGGDAARFLRWICEALEKPLLIALEG